LPVFWHESDDNAAKDPLSSGLDNYLMLSLRFIGFKWERYSRIGEKPIISAF
jgi:hypothetical protein